MHTYVNVLHVHHTTEIQYASKKSCQYRLPFDRSVQMAFCQNGTVTSKNGSHRLSVPFTVHRSPLGVVVQMLEQASALTR